MSLKIRSNRRKTSGYSRGSSGLKKIAIGAIVLLLLLGLAGLAYTWWMGKQATVDIPDAPVSKPVTKAPSTISDTAPVSVALQSLTTPVKPGENASMMVKTNPGAACSIKVEYTNNQSSTDTGLVPKNADEYGIVSWSWKVEENRLPGVWPATVTCANAENSGVYVGKLEIQR